MPSRQNLVIVLHGVGANGANLATVGETLRGFIPDAASAAPDAPNPFDGGGSGRQWFSVVGINTASWRGEVPETIEVACLKSSAGAAIRLLLPSVSAIRLGGRT